MAGNIQNINSNQSASLGSDSNMSNSDLYLLFGLFTLKPVFWAARPVSLHPGGKSSADTDSSALTVVNVSDWQIHD